MLTFFWVDANGDGVFHGTVDAENHVSKVGDVQRHHSDVCPPRKDQEAVHAYVHTAHAKHDIFQTSALHLHVGKHSYYA